MARTWNPAHHPRDKRGRFTRSATKVMTAADRKRGAKALESIRVRTFGDQAEARTYLDKIAKPAGPPVKQYLDGDWRTVNSELRAGKKPAGVDELDAAMQPLPDDLLLRREVPLSLFGGVPMPDLVGMKMRDAAYASTSLDLGKPSTPGAVSMHILAPSGTKAHVNAADGEILLARDSEVAITRVEPDGHGGWEMYGVVLPKAPTRPKRSGEPTEPPSTAPREPAEPARPAPVASKPETGSAALAAAPKGLHRPAADLTEQQRSGLSTYQDGGGGADFRSMNAALRTGKPGSEKTMAAIAGVDSAMAASALSADVEVHRGVRNARTMFGDRLDGDLTGLRWREDAFVSTSTEQAAVRDFSRGADSVEMRITAPAGMGAVDLSDPADPSEQELLLDKGHEFEVVADRGVVDGVRLLDIRALPKAEATPPETSKPPAKRRRAAKPDPLDAAPVSLVRRGDTTLTKPQRDALNGYKKVTYTRINADLRSGKTSDAIDRIDEVMTSSKLTSGVTVFRGLRTGRRAFGDRLKGDLTGLSWREDAYVSTSAREKVAADFADGGVLMRVSVPEGVGAVTMSKGAYESELLLERGLQLTVVKDGGKDGGKVGGIRVIDVEVAAKGGT